MYQQVADPVQDAAGTQWLVCQLIHFIAIPMEFYTFEKRFFCIVPFIMDLLNAKTYFYGLCLLFSLVGWASADPSATAAIK